MSPSRRDARIAALKVLWLVDAKNNPALRAQTQTKIDKLTRGEK